VSKRRKQARLEMTVASLRQRFGPQAVRRAESRQADDPAPAFPHIPTGFPALDEILGIGGLPRGRVSELLGQPTSGATTLALKFLSQAQDRGHLGYVDQARCFDPDYAHRCGLDLSRLVVGTPYGPTETLAMVEALVREGNLAALVLDTLDLFWDARAIQQLDASLGRVLAPLARAGTALLLLHDRPATGAPALDPLAHHTSVRLEVVRERWHERHGDIRGYEARVQVLKNRFAPAGRTATITIQFNGTVRGDGL
jgi:recombination protein RecA